MRVGGEGGVGGVAAAAAAVVVVVPLRLPPLAVVVAGTAVSCRDGSA